MKNKFCIPEPKFNVGNKIYYKYQNKVRRTTIRRIETTVKTTKKGTTCSIFYVATACGARKYWYNYKTTRNFKENEIFNSKKAVAKGMIPTEKSEILKKIKQIKGNITKSKKSIKKSNVKLDEIKKEELIEKLSGI